MFKVIDTKTGRERVMEKRYADLLVKLGRARYMTREMRAATPDESTPPAAKKTARKSARKKSDQDQAND